MALPTRTIFYFEDNRPHRYPDLLANAVRCLESDGFQPAELVAVTDENGRDLFPDFQRGWRDSQDKRQRMLDAIADVPAQNVFTSPAREVFIVRDLRADADGAFTAQHATDGYTMRVEATDFLNHWTAI